MRYILLAGCRKLGEIEAKSGYFTNFGTFSVLKNVIKKNKGIVIFLPMQDDAL